MSRIRKIFLALAMIWAALVVGLSFMKGGDFVVMSALRLPAIQVLPLLLVHYCLSSVIVVELLRLVVRRWSFWDNRQHFRAVGLTSLILSVVGISAIFYGRSTQGWLSP